jgi:anti-sigma regulatory factor (Ser/Thr protein kinase)
LTKASSPGLRTALIKAIADCPAAVVVDLTDLATVDPIALTILPAAAHQDLSVPTVIVMACLPARWRQSPLVMAALGGVPTHHDRAAALAEVADVRRRSGRIAVVLPALATSIGRARDTVLSACAYWDLLHVCDEARLIVSELVTNAIVHGRGEIRFELVLRDAFLHMRVGDHSIDPPRIGDPGRPDGDVRPGGRGLHLVDLYSASWGYRPDRHGKVVWATIRHRPVGAPAAGRPRGPNRGGTGDAVGPEL